MQVSYTKSKSGKDLTLTNNTSTYGGTNTSPYWVGYFGSYNRINVVNLYDTTQSFIVNKDGQSIVPTSTFLTTLLKDGMYKVQVILIPTLASGVLYNVGDSFVYISGSLKRIGKCLISNTVNMSNIFDGTNFVEITEPEVSDIYKSTLWNIFDVTCATKGVCKKLKLNNTEAVTNPNFTAYKEDGEIKDIYKAVNILTSLYELLDIFTDDNKLEIRNMINFLKDSNCCEDCDDC